MIRKSNTGSRKSTTKLNGGYKPSTAKQMQDAHIKHFKRAIK